ncbi:MAG: chromate transporter [Oscillospiraceae bacterium]|jgi:chromate transporter|nr:chromate transporter [Oscillospiraceae bacterium]
MKYLELFWAFFKVGLMSFGGGYAAMPLVQTQIVEELGWINMTDFTDMLAISQMTPGPISINLSTFVGARMGNLLGATAAMLGCIVPSCVIMLILTRLYRKFRTLETVQCVLAVLKPATLSMIAASGGSLFLLSVFGGEPRDLWLAGFDWRAGFDWFAAVIFAVGLVLLRIKRVKVPPVLIMLGAGVLGLVFSVLPAVNG